MHAHARTSRRHFLQLVTTAAAVTALPRSVWAERADLVWHDVRDWGVEGKGWADTKRYFDRLPGKAEGVVRPPVWDLSRHSAGMVTRFVTDSPAIHVRYTLLSDRLAMPHMPATGVSGLDFYATGGQGVDRWAAVVQPTEMTVEKAAAEGLRAGQRRYTVYLPLYNGVESLEIAVEQGATFTPLAPRSERPVLFYGTSIMHGACASRPGMSISAILGRRLNRPVTNLGFSGNGRMEPEVGALLAELDPCVFAIDCLPNMDEAMVDERAANLVRQLRAARPSTPILLVEDRSFTNTRFFPAREERHRTNRDALRRAFSQLQDEGVDRLYYLEGEQLLGEDGEAATDGSHPNDMGMVRYADAYEPALRAILAQY
ncbi:MAG: SGNH/GDSL hydrolase family protein [Rhodothermales bacterium]